MPLEFSALNDRDLVKILKEKLGIAEQKIAQQEKVGGEKEQEIINLKVKLIQVEEELKKQAKEKDQKEHEINTKN